MRDGPPADWSPGHRSHRPAWLAAAAVLMAALSGCASLEGTGAARTWPAAGPTELGRSADRLVVVAGRGDTAASLAERYLGDARRGWWILDANDLGKVRPGVPLVIPLVHPNPGGVQVSGLQTVPVLAYHRFGEGQGAMYVTPGRFEAQMAYLAEHGYRVVRLTELREFLTGAQPLPRRAVVITIDDGYRSIYHHAFPVLRRYGFPATVFIYTGYIGNGGLTWAQLEEMRDSGLIDIQSHSRSHDNLTRLPAPDAPYADYLRDEVRGSRALLERRLERPVESFSYPFGMVNGPLAREVAAAGYRLGVTVERGGNAFFEYPFAVRRSMIYRRHDLEDFRRELEVFRPRDLR